MEELSINEEKATELMQSINKMYNHWRRWQDIVAGEHGCYGEECSCTETCDFALQKGWRTLNKWEKEYGTH